MRGNDAQWAFPVRFCVGCVSLLARVRATLRLRFVKGLRAMMVMQAREVPSGLASCSNTTPALADSRAVWRAPAMTTKHSAYDSSLYRDVNDALALAALVAFVCVLLLACP